MRGQRTVLTAALLLGMTLPFLSSRATAQSTGSDRDPAATNSHRDKDEQGAGQRNLADMELEELMSIEVSSASRKSESLSQAPAAIFVISGEEIRRGGFSNLAEALRMVPGLYVARVNQRWWTVSARGFSDYLNNKMLVLIDGRSVYTQQFGGVYWDIQDVPLDDIERIEVIRGPGGTLWGANAVNGVINIISKKAKDTQGVSVATSGGIDEGYMASVRLGGRVGNLNYRMFGKGSYWYPGIGSPTGSAYDSAKLAQGGMRLDWKTSDHHSLTVEAAGYEAAHQNEVVAYTSPTSGRALVRETAPIHGGHILARWSHTFSGGSNMDVLGYCDWTDIVRFATEARRSCSAELQDDLKIGERHSLIWGGGVLDTRGSPYSSFSVDVASGLQNNTVVSGFGQYEFTVVPERLRLIGGAKFEHNRHTGFEVQPQVRAVWTPGKQQTIWGAVSRAVRVPNQLELAERFKLTQLPAAVPTFLTVVGNPQIESEVLRAYELGYRVEPSPRFSLDTAIFYNHYDHLMNVNLVDPFGVAGAPIVHPDPVYIEIPVPWQNLGSGQTHGAEVYLRVKPVNRWTVGTAITELRGSSFDLNDTLNLPVANTPQHQFNIQSRLNLTTRVEFDSALYHYNGIRGYQFGGILLQDVPTHNRVDVGLSFRRFNGFTFSAWAHDLAASPHWENRPGLFTTSGSEVGRTIVFKMMWQSRRED